MMPASLPFGAKAKKTVGVVGGLHCFSVAICFRAIVQWRHLSFAQLQRRIMMCCVSCPWAPLLDVTHVLGTEVSSVL